VGFNVFKKICLIVNCAEITTDRPEQPAYKILALNVGAYYFAVRCTVQYTYC